MTTPSTVPVSLLLEHSELATILSVVAGDLGLSRRIAHTRVQKSGLAFAGHVRGVDPRRVQVIGETETTFLESLDAATRRKNLHAYFALGPSCTLVTRGVTPLPDLVKSAAETDSPLIVSKAKSSETIHALHAALDRDLADTMNIHGVVVEVHGLGVLLLGPSGIGKSECALFLVERGHRLVADDAVILTRLPGQQVVGSPSPLLRQHLEIRGLGILNIRDLYGATATRAEAPIDLVIELCPWRDEENYERLGIDDATYRLMGCDIPMLKVPIRPGREMATILEVAARNQLLKRAGHHGARAFAARLEAALGIPDETVELSKPPKAIT